MRDVFPVNQYITAVSSCQSDGKFPAVQQVWQVKTENEHYQCDFLR